MPSVTETTVNVEADGLQTSTSTSPATFSAN
jgi:hypothetical protein